ncbi:MAG: hypothetical protein R3C58_02610 [Parvularculaceae bacterium]
MASKAYGVSMAPVREQSRQLGAASTSALEPEDVAHIMGRFLEGVLRAEGERRIVIEKPASIFSPSSASAIMLPRGAKSIQRGARRTRCRRFAARLDWPALSGGGTPAYVSNPEAAMTYWAHVVSIGLTAQSLASPRRAGCCVLL